MPLCSTDSVFKMFPSTRKRKAFVFKSLWFMKSVSEKSVLVRTVGLTVELFLQHHGVVTVNFLITLVIKLISLIILLILPEANNCFSIITQVIIEVPHRWKFFAGKATISDGDRKPLARSTDCVCCNSSRILPPVWDVKLQQTFIHHCKFGLLIKPLC